MSAEEDFEYSLKALDNHWAGLERSKEALREVEAQFQYGQGSGGASALLLLGESRVGKTHILERFEKNHPPVYGEERDERPVIKVDAPHSESAKWLSHRILRAMDFPRPEKATANSLSQDIIRFAREIRTRLIIVDEVHQLVSDKNGRPRELRQAVSLLKEILNDGQVSLVLSGTGNAAVFSNYDTEFGERVAVHRLDPHDWATPEDRREFRGYVDSVIGKLPLPLADELHRDEELAARLFVASDGYVGRVTRLFRDAAIWARIRNEKVIRRQALAQCFERTRKGQHALNNPFKPQRRSVKETFDLV